MRDGEKTRGELVDELARLRRRVSEADAAEAERKRVEEALRESEKRLQVLVDHAYDGISISRRSSSDPIGRRQLIYCNDRFVEMSGRAREELMACENLFELTVSPLADEEREANLQRMRKMLPYRGVSSWKRPDGRENHHEWVAVPVDIKGELYTIGIDRDITERRQMEERLREAERVRVLAAAAGGAAHEINQHLQVVVGLAQILLQKMPADSPILPDIEKIQEGGKRISEIVLKMQDVKQYATIPYVDEAEIVDFDAAAREEE